MKREVLLKRIPNGWSSKCGRVRALRDTSILEEVRNGAAVTTCTRLTYWDVQLLDDEGEILEEESVNTLSEADEEAYWMLYADRD